MEILLKNILRIILKSLNIFDYPKSPSYLKEGNLGWS